ncbi:recombinase family protein [Clostridium sp. A1-XYC3]|uniref:Recombinase family protein n=1 Tax=Clostridium tanneri TaxID=3037988 RepID=A0ABU4JWU9_9CLOT|nr:recombinase family protein [Clostridium sp. A1-XYC3]MDW8802637.1 recombinase family protein [Clostridium sp. A1-XYC3]
MADLKLNNKKAVLYARVSTEEQASRDNSIPAQIKAIKQFALKNDLNIVNEYVDEGKSARTADRPQFQQMISDAKKKDKNFSVILIHKTDRFARNRSDSVIYKTLLQKECGVEVISITEIFDDSPTGKLLEGMMEVIAEFHSLNLAQEVMKGMKQKAGKGLYVGRTPFGYFLDEDTKKLMVNEKEADVVKQIFHMYSNGDSFATIKAHLNNAGIFTRENKPWDSSALRRMINNPVYTGKYIWNKTRRSTNLKKDSSEWITVEDSHTPIITKNLYEEVQSVAKSKSTIKGKAAKSIYLLSSMIKCGHCGHNMIGDKKKHVSGKTYFRYVCGNYLNHRLCFYNFVHKDEIEKLVFENIREIVRTGIVDPKNIIVVESNASNSELDILNANLKKIKQKFQRQFEAFEAGIISLDELQEAKNRVLSEEKEVNQQINALKKSLQSTDASSSLKLTFNGIEDILELNDPTKIKLWLKERIYSIEILNKRDIIIKYKLPI